MRRKLTFAVAWLAFVFVSNSLAISRQPSQKGSTAAQSAESHISKGYEALKEDRYDEAAEEFSLALKLDSSLVLRARFPLAVALFESHKPDEARREFQTVRREVGDHPNVLYYLGRLDIESNDFARAIQNLNKAAAKPPFPDTTYYLGFAYFKNGDLVNAEKWLREAQRQIPSDSRVPYQLGLVYRKQGLEEKGKQSIALSQQLRQHDTNESRIKSECEMKLTQGPRAAAHAVCDQLYDPENADKLTALGTLYGQHGDLEAALKPLKRAAELAPQAPQMQYNLALTYFQLNQFDNARKPLAAAVERWPDLFPLNRLYGAVLMKSGDLSLAHDVLRHAHELNPEDAGTVDMFYATSLDLARQRQKDQKYSESLQYLKEAAQLKPLDPEPHHRLADIYQLMGRPAEATAEQDKAEQLLKSAS